MLQQTLNFIESAGAASITVIWVPLGIWAVLALIIMGLLRHADRMQALYQYHIRAALILALPAGLAGLQLVSWAETHFAGTTSFVPDLWVVERVFVVTSSGAPGGPAGIEWMPFLSGLLVLFLVLVSAIKLIRLAVEAYELSQFRRNSGSFSLAAPLKLDQSNIRLMNSIRFKPRLIVSAQSVIPFTHGCIRPLIVIPEALTGIPQKLNMAVRHELMHIQRGDFLLNALLLLTQSIFWFNPLLYPLMNQVRIYREISCDQQVLSEESISRKAYARLLVELAPRSEQVRKTVLSMSVEPSNLKKRIQTMNRHRKHRPRFRMSMSFLMVTMLGIALVMSCSDMQSSQDGSTSPSSSVHSPGSAEAEVQSAPSGEVPELIGGMKSFHTSIKYPEEARRKGIEGRVVVEFIVDPQGEVKDPRVVRGIGGGCDEEALQTIRAAAFKPGKHGGRVRVQYSILFRLMGNDGRSGDISTPDTENPEADSGTDSSVKQLGELVVVGYDSPSSEERKSQDEGFSEKDIEALRKAVELDPNDESSYHTLGKIYQNRSAALFEKRNQSRDNEEAQALDKRAREELREAMNYYEKAAEINPDNTDYWKSLFPVYLTLNMKEKAKEAEEKAGMN